MAEEVKLGERREFRVIAKGGMYKVVPPSHYRDSDKAIVARAGDTIVRVEEFKFNSYDCGWYLVGYRLLKEGEEALPVSASWWRRLWQRLRGRKRLPEARLLTS